MLYRRKSFGKDEFVVQVNTRWHSHMGIYVKIVRMRLPLQEYKRSLDAGRHEVLHKVRVRGAIDGILMPLFWREVEELTSLLRPITI